MRSHCALPTRCTMRAYDSTPCVCRVKGLKGCVLCHPSGLDETCIAWLDGSILQGLCVDDTRVFVFTTYENGRACFMFVLAWLLHSVAARDEKALCVQLKSCVMCCVCSLRLTCDTREDVPACPGRPTYIARRLNSVMRAVLTLQLVQLRPVLQLLAC